MAITNGYTTLALYKGYAEIDSTDATDDTVIEGLIERASRYIDDKTGRTFYARTETHYFDYPRSRTLKMDDDLLSVTTLTNGDGTEIANTEYNLLPYNDAPYFAIKLTDVTTTYWQGSSSGSYEKIITVLGTWGYAATAPDEIEQAVNEITKTLYNRRMGKNVGGVATVTAAGVVISPADVSADVKEIINTYKRRF
jgi:hypothetical protein